MRRKHRFGYVKLGQDVLFGTGWKSERKQENDNQCHRLTDDTCVLDL